MNHQEIITLNKECLLTYKTMIPTAFLVERRGVDPFEVVVSPMWQDGPPTPLSSFFTARKVAEERHWRPGDITEIGYVGIEKRDSKEILVIAFCALPVGAQPVFTEQCIEVKRPGGNVILIDHGESCEGRGALLPAFTAGVLSSPLTSGEMTELLLSTFHEYSEEVRRG